MSRSTRSVLWSTPLVTMTIAALALWGCGGGGSGTAVSGGTHVDGGVGSVGKDSGMDGGGGRGGGAAGAAGPGSSVAGTGGSAAGAGGAAAGTGGSSTGAGGSAAGIGGSSADAGVAAAGAGGSSMDAGGSAAGTGGSSAGAGGASPGAGGAAAGAGGTAPICPGGTGCTATGNVPGICAGNVCIPCTNDAAGDAACVVAYGTGQICVSNACVAGDCHNANAECTNGEVCLSNTCSPCTADVQCGNGMLCDGNACVTGDCRATDDCPAVGGLVCINRVCSPCTTDTQCSLYGADICVSNVCTLGNCHSTGNCGSTGQICNLTNHTCSACSSDAQCADPANYNTGHYCQNNVCVAGSCRASIDCPGGKLCNASLTCISCNNSTECTVAFGSNHVCVGGSCVSGNCSSTTGCVGSGQLCQGTTCVGCNADIDCTNDPAYGAEHICSNHQCISGNCHTSGDCVASGNQLCDAGTHTCAGCISDAACQADTTYGSTAICLDAACSAGDCHDTSNDCTNGQVCGASTAHACGACTGDTQCANDAHYGPGHICYLSSCTPGDCHGTSVDCKLNGNPGLICGASAANTCGKCSTDTQCKSDTVYGIGTICETAAGAKQGTCVSSTCITSGACAANASDFCCGSTCVPGNCCVDEDCGSFGTACVAHTCSACNAVSGNKFYVDPVNGNDSTATGSDMAGAVTAPGCAFKTVARAIQAIPPSPAVGTQIIVIGRPSTPTDLVASDLQSAAAAIILPANTTLTTAGGAITITLKTTVQGTAAGFQLQNNGSGIAGNPAAPLTLNGTFTAGNVKQTGIGVIVNPAAGSTSTFNLSNVTILNTNGHGIRVNAGNLNIGAGVVVNGSNQDGLLVAAGVANINNASGAQTLFTNNVARGVESSGTGSVNIIGTPGAPIPSNNGTVVSSFNNEGIRINQTPGAAGLGTNSIDGLVAWANLAIGAHLYGGSLVKIRNSIFLSNVTYGVQVSSANGTTAAGNDVSALDLGTPADFGHNYLQAPLGALGFNSSGGLCVALSNYAAAAGQPATLTETMKASGNQMVTTGNTQVDCSITAGTITQGTCGGMRSSGINAATNITTTTTFSLCK